MGPEKNFDMIGIFDITVFELTGVFAIVNIENTVGTGKWLRRYMAEILPIRYKTLYNQSINRHIRGFQDYPCNSFFFSFSQKKALLLFKTKLIYMNKVLIVSKAIFLKKTKLIQHIIKLSQ